MLPPGGTTRDFGLAVQSALSALKRDGKNLTTFGLQGNPQMHPIFEALQKRPVPVAPASEPQVGHADAGHGDTDCAATLRAILRAATDTQQKTAIPVPPTAAAPKSTAVPAQPATKPAAVPAQPAGKSAAVPAQPATKPAPAQQGTNATTPPASFSPFNPPGPAQPWALGPGVSPPRAAPMQPFAGANLFAGGAMPFNPFLQPGYGGGYGGYGGYGYGMGTPQFHPMPWSPRAVPGLRL